MKKDDYSSQRRQHLWGLVILTENMTYPRDLMKLSMAEAQGIMGSLAGGEAGEQGKSRIVRDLVDHVKDINLYFKDNGEP